MAFITEVLDQGQSIVDLPRIVEVERQVPEQTRMELAITLRLPRTIDLTPIGLGAYHPLDGLAEWLNTRLVGSVDRWPESQRVVLADRLRSRLQVRWLKNPLWASVVLRYLTIPVLIALTIGLLIIGWRLLAYFRIISPTPTLGQVAVFAGLVILIPSVVDRLVRRGRSP